MTLLVFTNVLFFFLFSKVVRIVGDGSDEDYEYADRDTVEGLSVCFTFFFFFFFSQCMYLYVCLHFTSLFLFICMHLSSPKQGF
jgi:hypothetical protein